MYVQGSERVVNTRDFNMKVSNMYCKALMLIPKIIKNKNVGKKYILISLSRMKLISKVTKVSFFVQCTKMQSITLQIVLACFSA